ncbi:MAG: hypothetical protein K2X53_05015 [Alphaproteobacteria bacterium]|nr:hypothetical protein [Alphaproteobacteria bacterium]
MNKILSLIVALLITTSAYAFKIDIAQDGEAYVANAQKTFKGTFKASLLSSSDAPLALEEKTLEVSFKPLAQFTSVEVPAFSGYAGDSDFVRFSGSISFDDTVIQLNDFVQSGLITGVKLNITSNPMTAIFYAGSSSY